ncbi:hypothetical protein KFL_000430160 [Klebsormidium nitens]|uniref:Codanin-1 C-terminal domain-containing protein n=1 Tax=Klebsormidium nitens TaxID=105231 RepID=A0A1Y1HMX3_KLENI|nr:hypothetical protein KFL_000430160 [Klebsormidium nitens]|eukprot:GAQ79974.1 hypothetical protein KFL_000430160 [Klebsormidium nitens]
MERRMGSRDGGQRFGGGNSYDAAFPSLGATLAPKRRADKQRKKITPTPVAAAQVDSTFLLAQPAEDSGPSFGRTAKSTEVDLRLLLKEKRGRSKGGQNKEHPLSEAPLIENQNRGFSGAVSGDGQPGKLAGALEGRLGGGQSAWGTEEPTPSALPGPSAEFHTPPRSRRLAPSRCDGPHLSHPAESPQLLTPTSGAQFKMAERRPPSPPKPSGEVSSSFRLPEKPPKLPPEQQRAAEAHGELLKRGGVPFLLQELQLIVELLTANQTSCAGEHAVTEGKLGHALGGLKGTAGAPQTLASKGLNRGEAEGEGTGFISLSGEVHSEQDFVSQSLVKGASEGPVNRLEEGAESAGQKEAGGLGSGRQTAGITAVSEPLKALERTPGSSSSPEGKERPYCEGESATSPEASLPRGVLSFCCGDMAATYACEVLETSLPLILHCGEPLLTALLHEPAIPRHSPTLTAHLREALIAHQSASLRGLGTPQKRGGSAGGAPLSALPFNEEQDSRNIPAFKTQEGQRLFSNREECRDIFYCIIRDAASTSADFASEPVPPSLKSAPHKHPFRRPAASAAGTLNGYSGRAAPPRPEKPLGFPSRVRQLLAHLHESNYPWLAKLFVQQIIQVASTGETDPEVRSLAREDTAKLQRLHSRLMGAGAAPVRLAAGGTPTRESPGRRFRGFDGTSPVFVGGVRQGSPGLESTPPGETGVKRELGRGPRENLREELREGRENGSRDGGQTVRRTLEGMFGESESDRNREGGPVGVPEKKGGSDGQSAGEEATEHVKEKEINIEKAASTVLSRQFASTINSILAPSTSPGRVENTEGEIRKGLSVAVARNGDPLAEDGPFGGLFSRTLVPYVRFVQAADSHRLHLLLLRCIADSIHSLSQVGAASVFSASSFSERLVTLQTLARFLGFLLFAPISTGHSPLPTDPKSPVYTWSGELPISPVDALQAAMLNGSLLLNLPWVLEVLGMMRACAPAKGSPTFGRALAEVERLQGLPALLPSRAGFGLPSMCITAALEAFFREDSSSPPEPPQTLTPSETLQSPLATWPPRDTPDFMPGLIDARYIQNCCPLLDDLAATLLEARQRTSQIDGPDAAKPGDRRSRPIRKITPTPPPQAAQPGGLPADVLAALPAEDAELVRPPQRDPLRTKLEGVFFEQQPQLRRLVDFVVDTVAANSALAAQLATCPDVISAARAQLAERAERAASDGAGVGRVEMFIEQTILSACRQGLPPAIAYARKHSRERVCEALGALARPNIAPPVLGTAAAVAAQASAVGAAKLILVNVPKEIRQRLTEGAEKLKKKMVAAFRIEQARKLVSK